MFQTLQIDASPKFSSLLLFYRSCSMHSLTDWPDELVAYSRGPREDIDKLLFFTLQLDIGVWQR